MRTRPALTLHTGVLAYDQRFRSLHPATCPTFSTRVEPPTCAHPTLPPRFYGQVFPASGRDDVAILDMCSSWISHYPKGYKAGKVVGEWHEVGGLG